MLPASMATERSKDIAVDDNIPLVAIASDGRALLSFVRPPTLPQLEICQQLVFFMRLHVCTVLLHYDTQDPEDQNEHLGDAVPHILVHLNDV